MFRKIIYFRHIPLTKKVYFDFYMDLQKELSDIEFEYWDLSKIYFSDDVGQEDSSDLMNTRFFESLADVEYAIRNEDSRSCLYLSLLTFEGRVRSLFQIFTKYNCLLGVFAKNMFPTGYYSQSFIDKLNSITYKRLINYLQTKLLLRDVKLKKIKLFDFVFLAGKLGWKSIGRINQDNLLGSEVININSDDYDCFLQKIDCKRIVEDKYILFLDQYLPLHPDLVLFGVRKINAEIYYKDLNAYFEYLERKTGKIVVIAAHPKAYRYKTESFFNGRQVFFDLTPELVKYADFVLAHYSTAVNFPICFDKKIHFITSHSLQKGVLSIHLGILNFAYYLRCNYQFIDDINENLSVVKEISDEKYTQYKYDFQTSPMTESLSSRSIFKDFLLKGDK